MFKLFKANPKDLLIDSNSSINTDIMNFLSIDCSTNVGSLFVKVKNKSFSKVLQSDKSNNDLLMKQILDFFAENNLVFNDIGQIFVNQGPGNFSGLRGSLAIAKGVSLSTNLHLFGYNTFIWSCAKFFNKKNTICSLINFKEEIIKSYDDIFKVIPKNMTKHFDEKILKLDNLSVVDLDHNVLEFLQLKGLLDKDLIKPLYLN